VRHLAFARRELRYAYRTGGEIDMTLYIGRNDERMGPYSLSEAQSLAAAGTLQPTDWAWYEGLTTWIPLQEVPGFSATTGSSMPPAYSGTGRPKRPVLVWIICLFYFICTPFSLLSLVFIHMLASGSLPMPEAQRHFFESQNAFDYGLTLLNFAIILTWAILLFLLKRQSLYVFLGALGFGIAMLIYNILAKDWLAAAGTVGLITLAVSWIFNLALLYYNWHLYRKGVLR
jgi:hypothetical protein